MLGGRKPTIRTKRLSIAVEKNGGMVVVVRRREEVDSGEVKAGFKGEKKI